jgi:murein DD-endopeptidase MepM/ murein hydrolase activator NlpD
MVTCNMIRTGYLGITALLIAMMTVTAPAGDIHKLVSVDVTHMPTPEHNCVPASAYQRLAEEQRGIPSASGAALFPTLHWPMDIPFGGPIMTVGYPDNDLSSPGRMDYEGGTHAQDGHRGMDFALLSFHTMDSGVITRAAADGVVSQLEWTKFDRNVLGPFPDQGNQVILRHADNSFTYYWHLRKNSLTVQLGDTVSQGEMLGLTGSSGFSFQAHTHFEIGFFSGGSWIFRDPNFGTFQPLFSLWDVQNPYIGFDTVKVFDMDITTNDAAGGSIGTLTSPQRMERVTAPAIMGADELHLGLWLLIRGQQGDEIVTRLYRPNGTEFSNRNWIMPVKSVWTWITFVWAWSGQVNPADCGTWRAVAEVGGQEVKETLFEVGATTAYAPRFEPIAGRSLRMNGLEQRDTLRLGALSSPSTFALMNEPAYVSLVEDSIVVVDSGAVLGQRSEYFEVEATDMAGRTDTMWYHLVDVNRPKSCAVNMTGDLNGSGSLTSADIIAMVNFTFKGAPPPEPCIAVGDINCSGGVTSSDIIGMVNIVFKGADDPCDVCTIIPQQWACP